MAVPFGKGKVVRPGTDVTIVGVSLMAYEAVRAAEILAEQGVDAEVIDLRSVAAARRGDDPAIASEDGAPGGGRHELGSLRRLRRGRRDRGREGLGPSQGAGASCHAARLPGAGLAPARRRVPSQPADHRAGVPRRAEDGDADRDAASPTSRPPSPDHTELTHRRRVSVFVPAYNEAENLERAVATSSGPRSRCSRVRDPDRRRRQPRRDGTARRPPRRGERSDPGRPPASESGHRGGLRARARRGEARLLQLPRRATGRSLATPSATSSRPSGRLTSWRPYHQNPRARQLHRRLLTWTSTRSSTCSSAFACNTTRAPASIRSRSRAVLPKTAGGFYFLTEMLVHALHAGYSYVEVGPHPPGPLPRPIQGRVRPEYPEGAAGDRAAVVVDPRAARAPSRGGPDMARTSSDGARHWRRWLRRSRAGPEAPGRRLSGSGRRSLSLRRRRAARGPGPRAR